MNVEIFLKTFCRKKKFFLYVFEKAPFKPFEHTMIFFVFVFHKKYIWYQFKKISQKYASNK